MRRTLLASLGVAVALLVWAGTAAAQTGSPAAPAGETASSDPTATALGLVAQYLPAGTLDSAAGASTAPAQAERTPPPQPPAPAPAPPPAPAPAPAPAGTGQANGTLAGSLGANGNETGQTVSQQQPGGTPTTYVPPAAPAAAPTTAAPAPAPAPAPAATQVAGQSSHSTQTADADADATQIAPTNTNIGVRIGSEGNNGAVEQSNDAIALAGALNGNETTQGLTQSQGGSGSGKQIAGQSAKNDQSATANADATQVHPTNTNISVRIFSPGNDGPVSQSNTAIAGSLAGNANETTQTVDQSQGGGGSGGTQIAGQKADNEQTAHANADAKQVHPSNTNISVRIFSEGDNGPVTQSNTAAAGALSGNLNETTQSTKQSQAGGAPVDHCASACTAPAGSALQAAGQSASNTQCACANATATQIAPSNENASIRIGSPGADGPVTQSNASLALAGALNGNKTTQTIGQSQGGSGGTAVQAAGQKATNDQHANADADAFQAKPSNVNAPVRIWSGGGGGSVEQTNAALAGSLAANLNGTTQTVEQSQGGSGGTGVQAAAQIADSHQSADADADATQCCASNVNVPVRIFSWGDDGDVSQTNLVGALAVGLNGNTTTQSLTQSQTGSYGGTAVQAAGQKADNDQHADADADAHQFGALNLNAPFLVGKDDRCEKHDRCDERDRCDKRDPCERPEKHGSYDEPGSYDKGQYDTPGSYGNHGGYEQPGSYDEHGGYDKQDRYEKPDCYEKHSGYDERDCYAKHDPCKRVDPCAERDPCERYDPCVERDPCKRHDTCQEPCKRSPCEERYPEPRKEVYER
jgi:hypothetical protein